MMIVIMMTKKGCDHDTHDSSAIRWKISLGIYNDNHGDDDENHRDDLPGTSPQRRPCLS